MTKICQVCGNAFDSTNGNKVYCSIECRHESKLEQRRTLHKDEKKRKTNGEIIDAYSREANSRHISYGALQAERYLKKMREG